MRWIEAANNLAVTISADWHSPIISATIYLRVARRGSIIADVIRLQLMPYLRHPEYDLSDRQQWHTETSFAKIRPDIAAVIVTHRTKLLDTAIEQARSVANPKYLSERRHIEENELLLAPYSENGFLAYVQIVFLHDENTANAENDTWWAFVVCSQSLPPYPRKTIEFCITDFGWTSGEYHHD